MEKEAKHLSVHTGTVRFIAIKESESLKVVEEKRRKLVHLKMNIKVEGLLQCG